MKLPQDPVMLLSAVNTKLRDYYGSLDELCRGEGAQRCELEKKLEAIGYKYDDALNQFV